MNHNARAITYRGQTVSLFYHPYNCGVPEDKRTTERTVELALADYWLKKYDNDAVELGAVTPYYFPGRLNTVVDPSDKHELVTERRSLFEFDFTGRNVLSISTIEHVGTQDYDKISLHENSINALNLILKHSARCLITFPVGYNAVLDEYVFNAKFGKMVTITFIHRSMIYNNWKTTHSSTLVKHLPYGPQWANALVVIEK